MNALVLVEEDREGAEEVPVKPGMTIGREGCDLVVDDPEVSRRHVAFRAAGEEVLVDDLGSTNGTRVNDRELVDPVPVGDGDEIGIGGVVFRVRARDGGAPRTRVATPPQPSEPDRPAEPAAAAAVPSVVRGAIRAANLAHPPDFAAPLSRRRRGSAARRVGATVLAFAVVLLDAIALAIYFGAT